MLTKDVVCGMQVDAGNNLHTYLGVSIPSAPNNARKDFRITLTCISACPGRKHQSSKDSQ